MQKGGGFNIEYKNNMVKFKSMLDDDRLNIYLSTLDNTDETCIFIIVDKSDKTAYIEGITNSKENKCFDNPELNKGFTIMEITIKMLKKYKNKLNIKNIQLKDNSFIYCDNKIKIWLASLSQLQYNNTFYGRFGFVPLDEEVFRKYDRTINILKNTLTNKLNLNSIILEYNKKIHNEINIMKYYIKYKDANITVWFNKISHLYLKEDCDFFKFLIDAIFYELKIDKMIHESFILKL